MILIPIDDLKKSKEKIEEESKKLNSFIADDPKFLDLTVEEQNILKLYYQRECQFLDVINKMISKFNNQP